MKQIYRNIAALLLFGFAGSAAIAGSLPETLFAPAADVDRFCQTSPQNGITCVRAGDLLSPSGLGTGSVSLAVGERFIFDQQGPLQVKGFLVLTPMNTQNGNPYYQAAAVIFKTGFAGIGMTSTDLYDGPFWSSVGTSVSFALPGSEDEQAFLRQMDAQIAASQAERAKREAAEAAAAAKRAAVEAYRASPEYAREQSRQQVESCKLTITRARAEIAQDQRVAQISGYENKYLRETAAIAIINCQDMIARASTTP